MSANTIKKAHEYLTGGRVKLWLHTSTEAVIHVYGSKPLQPYYVTFSETQGWNCNCEARTECAHLIAAQIISPLKQPKTITLGA